MDSLVFFLLINSSFPAPSIGTLLDSDGLKKGLPVDITDGTMFRQRLPVWKYRRM
jgi:hypothetical protein